MATVNDIITDALEITGIKSIHDALAYEWETTGLRRLNSILDGWNVSKIKGYGIKELEFSLQSGKGVYTIGSGGDFDTPKRPVKIENCFVIDASGVNHTVSKIDYTNFHKADYPNNQNSYPYVFWYNPLNPLGEINFYPVPSTNYTVHFDVYFGFDSYSLGTDVVSLPQGYEKLLTYQLAVEICSHIGLEVPRHVFRVFKMVENDIESINFDSWMTPPDITAPNTNGFRQDTFFTMDRGI